MTNEITLLTWAEFMALPAKLRNARTVKLHHFRAGGYCPWCGEVSFLNPDYEEHKAACGHILQSLK